MKYGHKRKRGTGMALLIERPQEICDDHLLLKIDIGSVRCEPGQFVNMRIGDSLDPLLRRPFSVFNQEGGMLELVIQVVGKATRWLRDHAGPGPVDLLFPLGKGFTLEEGKSVLLVGGGVGNAPLYYLARRLKKLKNRVTYLYGVRSSDCMFLHNRFEAVSDEFFMATDDGTCGHRGRVTDLAHEVMTGQSFDRVYACGPTVMMQSMAGAMAANSFPFEVSVETYFGCGIGICSGCTVATSGGNRRACVDGPVFDGREINWPALGEASPHDC